MLITRWTKGKNVKTLYMPIQDIAIYEYEKNKQREEHGLFSLKYWSEPDIDLQNWFNYSLLYSEYMYKKAISSMREGKKDLALMYLGYGLHAIQDVHFNHFEKDSVFYRKYFTDLEDDAISSSEKYIRRFIDETGKIDPSISQCSELPPCAF